ncbi:TM2 domain-containing protein 1, partial [Eschrichtius robustus]|nr:TM2 domain-containing protein 1 [Eschrichtius robustus]
MRVLWSASGEKGEGDAPVPSIAAAWPSGPVASETAAAWLLAVLWAVSVTTGPWGAAAGGSEESLKCEDLKVGKNICKDPKINDATQEPVNCTNYTAHVPCFPAPNITCKDFGGNETHFTGNEIGFLKPISCRNVFVKVLHCRILWNLEPT